MDKSKSFDDHSGDKKSKDWEKYVNDHFTSDTNDSNYARTNRENDIKYEVILVELYFNKVIKKKSKKISRLSKGYRRVFNEISKYDDSQEKIKARHILGLARLNIKTINLVTNIMKDVALFELIDQYQDELVDKITPDFIHYHMQEFLLPKLIHKIIGDEAHISDLLKSSELSILSRGPWNLRDAFKFAISTCRRFISKFFLAFKLPKGSGEIVKIAVGSLTVLYDLGSVITSKDYFNYSVISNAIISCSTGALMVREVVRR